MKSYSLSDLARKTSAVLHDAARAPVAITERNKPRFVLMAIEDYQTLTQRAENPRRAFLLKDITTEDAALLKRGLDGAMIEDAADDQVQPTAMIVGSIYEMEAPLNQGYGAPVD